MKTATKAQIRFGGRLYTIAEAGALATRGNTRGNFKAALEIYDLILAAVPSYAEAHNNRGITLQAMNRYEDALIGLLESGRVLKFPSDGWQMCKVRAFHQLPVGFTHNKAEQKLTVVWS